MHTPWCQGQEILLQQGQPMLDDAVWLRHQLPLQGELRPSDGAFELSITITVHGWFAASCVVVQETLEMHVYVSCLKMQLCTRSKNWEWINDHPWLIIYTPVLPATMLAELIHGGHSCHRHFLRFRYGTTRNPNIAECQGVCRVQFFGHSANNLFAKCHRENTRQKKALGK
jgi:hypothetical protein